MHRPALRRDERGAVLVTVVVLMVLCFTVVTVVASSSMFGIRQTEDDQSRLQALAAAEAGRDYTLWKVSTACDDTGYDNPADTPEFSTTFFWVPTTTPPTDKPATAQSGCGFRSATTDGYVGIESEGKSADGTASKKVLAWYPYTVEPTVTNTYGAVYMNGLGSGGGWDQYRITGPGGDVTFAEADGNSTINCNGSDARNSMSGSLTLAYPLKASAQINCNIAGNLNLTGPGEGKQVSVNGTVDGWVNSRTGDVKISGGPIGGNVWAGGAIDDNNHLIQGTPYPNGTGTPPPISVPPWAEYQFKPEDFTGWTVVDASTKVGDQCDLSQTNQKADGNQKPTYGTQFLDWLTSLPESKVVVTFSKCNSQDVKFPDSFDLALNKDVTFVAAGLNLRNVKIRSVDSTHRTFNVLTSDPVPSDGKPTTTAANGFPACRTTTVEGMTMQSTVSGLVYTPCQITSGNGITWNGQMIGGVFASSGSGSSGNVINYSSVLPPGFPPPSGTVGGAGEVSLLPNLTAQTEPSS